MLEGIYIDNWFQTNLQTFIWLKAFLAFWCLCVHVLYLIRNPIMLATYYVRISTSHIYFYPALVFISSFIWSIFSCDQAALWMVFSVRLSVCLCVCLSVCPSHLFDYVPIIASSWNFQELSPRTRVTCMQKVKVRGQRSRSQRSRPKFLFPDCNSSLNSHMMMKWYI